jgi:hypothetical protein
VFKDSSGLPIVLLSFFLFLSCADSKVNVALSLSINKQKAESGTPIEVIYSLSTKDEFKPLEKDTTLFIHFMDSKNQRRFQDDHIPPKPLSAWRPNETQQWTRTIFIPKNIPEGEYVIIGGLYSPSHGNRIALDAKPHRNRSYELGKIHIRESLQLTRLDYVSGWYDPETNPKDIWRSWRWTKQEAILKTKNPKSDAVLYVRLEGVPHRFSEPQTLTLFVEDRQIDRFAIITNQPFLKKYHLDQKQLGSNEEIQLKFVTDKTFTPASDGTSRDTRELGVLVHNIYFDKASHLN